MSKPLVVITGCSGFLGAHVTLTFLKDGNYRVRGTVRSKSNEEKIKPLKEAFGGFFEQLELVEADLNDENSIVKACEGADFLVHTASPFNFEGDCVGPAVRGTNAALKACEKNGIKKVVITSSCAAIMACADEDKPPKGQKFNEKHWSNPDRKEGLNDYFESKTKAEKAAWDYQANHPELEIVTINPCFILGPTLAGSGGVSQSHCISILDGSKEKIPLGGTGVVDVRDVAIGHLNALKLPEAANKRFILYNRRVTNTEAYKILASLNKSHNTKVPTVEEEGDDPEFDLVDNTQSVEVLGIKYTSVESTFLDMAQKLLAQGKVKV